MNPNVSCFTAVVRTASLIVLLSAGLTSPAAGRVSNAFHEPISVYNNWAAYDELSDKVVLTEDLAMRQLREILRLRAQGVRFDYYVMDAYWFAPDGGYRAWRKPNWPDGPERWLAACRANGIKPGLWLSTNNLSHLEPFSAWENSLTKDRNAMCLFAGGYLPHLMETLQLWYDRGVRAYKFDFANFTAATPEFATLPRDEIVRRNENAWREALAAFRAKNPDVVLQAYNGYGGDRQATWMPFKQNVDLRWLEVFDSLYCGDPRPADVPAMNFFRSVDIYSDHMVRRYASNGVPLERIDACYPMIGDVATVYWRKQLGWKGTMVLGFAHGTWMNVLYGDLSLLSDDDARWLARVQRLFFPLQAQGRCYLFGGVPGQREPYGFAMLGETGSIYAVVNPAQTVATLPLTTMARSQARLANGRVLFRDAGFVPALTDAGITLGPEQMAVVGFGRYAGTEHDLGVQTDIVIPASIAPIALSNVTAEANSTVAQVRAPAKGGLRIVMQQFTAEAGTPFRSRGGRKPPRISLEQILRIEVRRGDRALPVTVHHNRCVWSGLSWAVGEVAAETLQPDEALTVRGFSAEPTPVTVKLEAYAIQAP